MPDTNRTASGVLGGLAGLVGLSAVAGVLVAATVTPAIALSGAAATSAITMFDNLPSVLDIEKLMLPTTLYAKSTKGDEWVELTQFYDQNRAPVEYDEVSPVMYDAILSSEDPRYYQHGGVDLIGTTRAVLSNVSGGGETQGGSTISQQYVKNILVQRCEAQAKTEEEKLNCWTQATTAVGDEGIQRKLQEMRYAIALEQKYDKETILLGYLNIANFGGQTYGIEAAAKYYFGVSAKDLNITQSSILAGIVQNPNTYRIDMQGGTTTNAEGVAVNGSEDGYALTKKRQQYVLDRLLEDGKITQEQHDKVYDAAIKPKITAPKTGCAYAKGAEYFCQYVRYVIERDPAFGARPEDRLETLRRGGLNVYTTLDWSLQRTSQETISAVTPTSVPGTKFGSASVSLEASTGRVLAISQNTKFSETRNGDNNYSSIVYAGDSTFGQSGGFNVGSTFKLFTLVDWLEQGHSVNEMVDGRDVPIAQYPDSCYNGGMYYNVDQWKPGNFGGGAGGFNTPMQFTAQSVNSGYVAMASKLDLCDIGKVADKMGVTRGNGEKIVMKGPNNVIGSDEVAPIAMAGAYATIANKGVYCQPQAILKVTDSDGNEIPVPERKCSQVVDPTVAATAAYALQGVMNGGTGARGNPYDGTPLIGKTGTHQQLQTWLVESSTRVATAVWVGNANGNANLFQTWANNSALSDMRYPIANAIQRRADELYPGSPFPSPDPNLTRQVLKDLPNVVGMSLDEARQRLQEAGFGVTEGAAVNSTEAKGIVAEQSPGAGRVATGTVVTISPSNGKGVVVPDVSGLPLGDALSALSGFGRVNTDCQQDDDAEGEIVTKTNPGANEVVDRNARITVTYVSNGCDGGKGNGGKGNGNG